MTWPEPRSGKSRSSHRGRTWDVSARSPPPRGWPVLVPMSSMTLGRTISFSLSVIGIAVAVALSAPSGPDSPRAKLAGWLRAHGYPEVATVVAPDVTQLPGMGGGTTLPPLP